ncbi:MAG: glycerophosphodiester phosphodiesterase [Thermoanaerobaculia bacterium]|nr:glycerophosphodiester phosphodiesterase [Thermoanaerobaculia bacterium]
MPSKAAHRRLRIYGHRGDRRRALENTLESFSIALGDGADGIETDVRRLADGTLVLFHDDEIGGTPVELFTFAELSVAWPGAVKLESLRELHGHGELILEVKRRGYARELIDAVGELDRVVIASFDHRLVAELAGLREKFSARFELGVTIAGTMVGGARYTRDLGARWLFPAHTFVDYELVSEFVEAGLKVVPWTPNSAPWWESFRNWGCHGVITDVPADAAAWRETAE